MPARAGQYVGRQLLPSATTGWPSIPAPRLALGLSANGGVERSTDEGDTWTTVLADTGQTDARSTTVGSIPRPPTPRSSSSARTTSRWSRPAGDAQGLIRSTDGGAAWKIVKSLDGVTSKTWPSNRDDALTDGAGDPGRPGLSLERRGPDLEPSRQPPGQQHRLQRDARLQPHAPARYGSTPRTPTRSSRARTLPSPAGRTRPPLQLGGASITFAAPDSVYIPWYSLHRRWGRTGSRSAR